MRIAIVCYHHVDVTVPIIKYLKNKIDIDLYLVLDQSSKNSTLIDLTDKDIPNGLIPRDVTLKLLPENLRQYFSDYSNINLYIYNSYYRYDIINFAQSVEFSIHLRKQKYDLIHFIGNSTFVIILHLFLKKIPRVHTIHEPISHSGKTSLINWLQMKYLIRNNINLILPSEISYKRFKNHYKINNEQANKILFGLLEPYGFYKKGTVTKNEKSILYFGIIQRYKGVEYLIRACQIAITTIPDLHVIIAGRGKINYDINEIGKNKNYEIINRHLSNEEIAELNEKSTIVVLPYTSASQSGVVMTAYHFNNPIIASDVEGLNSTIIDGMTGILVPPKDVEALSKAIISLINDKERIQEMRKNIRNIYTKGEYAWETIAEQTLELYKRSIKQFIHK